MFQRYLHIVAKVVIVTKRQALLLLLNLHDILQSYES
jgi:hypothetical protein